MFHKVLITAFGIIALSACQHNYIPRERAFEGQHFKFEYELKIPDDIFPIKLTNHSDKDLCYSPENWPSHYQDLHFGEDILSAVVDGKEYKYFDQNLGYPPPPEERIEPGKSLDGTLKLSKFGIDPNSVSAEKFRLIYKHIVYSCN